MAIPSDINDPINRRILQVSEDRLKGFVRHPWHAIAQQTQLDVDTVTQRLVAMLEAGVIRRIRQTLLTTSLAPGALVAWHIDPDRLDDAFDFMARQDPFTGHVVVRSTDPEAAGAAFRLWTTVKVPQGYAVNDHCEFLRTKIRAHQFIAMPAKKVFALGVGHIRRQSLEPGDRDDHPARPIDVKVVKLTEAQWQALVILKQQVTPQEIGQDIWARRAAQANMSVQQLVSLGQQLDDMGVIGRFSTFLEHAKPTQGGEVVSRYNGLFHWAVPQGREIEAGCEVGRHHVMTHAYWREGGPQFNHVNIMGVAHGNDQQRVLKHKAAIDQHLAEAGISVNYTNVFWGGRSEIKPSEIDPTRYRHWASQMGMTFPSPPR